MDANETQGLADGCLFMNVPERSITAIPVLVLVLSEAVLVLVIDFGTIHHSEILRFDAFRRSASG